MSDKLIRVGGASGAWGDSPGAIGQLLGAGVDYLVMDYLAEVTMSLLARARMKNPEGGYPSDFVAYLKPHLPEIADRRVKVVTNAGGVNPAGCKRALEAEIEAMGLSLSVAIVEGDDVMPLIETLRAAGVREAVSGEALPPRLLTANAYLGALPIRAALNAHADIVITGRCADSALALGILIHEFGWAEDDYDRLGAGSLVGHILECGPQATGGTFTDWDSVPGWHNIGYPIAECRSDGSFIVYKPDETGGLINPAVIAEQTLYEIGDPAAYLLPDVTADFSNVRLTQVAPDRVKVEGARGRPPTSQYKVSATYQDGYRAVASVSIVGPDAARKAERTGEALLARARMLFGQRGLPDFSETLIEALGAEASYGAKSATRATREVLLRLVVVHPSRDAIEIFARELGSIGLSCAPGTTGIYTGRPKPTPMVRLFTFFLEKSVLGRPKLRIGDAPPIEVDVQFDGGYVPSKPTGTILTEDIPDEATIELPLVRLAYARSGDKGDSSNIAVIARKPLYMPLLRRELTPQRMVEHLGHLVDGPAERFEAPGLNALNFLIQKALGGGGMASLRIDPQGKAYGQMALEMMISVPITWAQELCATMQDITEAERATQERVATQNLLKESEARYRSYFETAMDAQFVTAPDGSILEANTAACEMLGRSADEIIRGGRHAVIDVNDLRVHPMIQELARIGKARGEFTMIRADGTRFHVEGASSVFTDAAGRKLTTISVRDITVRNQTEEAMRRTQKMEALGTLAGGIAHDLNNTLVPILGLAKLIAKSLPETGIDRLRLALVLTAADRAKDLVKQILTFARGEATELTPIDMTQVVGEALQMARASMSRTIELWTEIASEPLPILGNPAQIDQVIMNLCDNAAYAMGGRVGKITVILRAERGGEPTAADIAKLSVIDDGIGMDEATRQRIFDPFFTTKEIGEGTGLGLAIVHGIVAVHGGTIAVDSRVGEGTRFDFSFPLIKGETEAGPV